MIEPARRHGAFDPRFTKNASAAVVLRREQSRSRGRSGSLNEAAALQAWEGEGGAALEPRPVV